MKATFLFRCCLALTLGVFLMCRPVVGATVTREPIKVFIGLADGYPAEVRTNLQDVIARLILELPPGTEICVDDAVSLSTVAGPVVVPQLKFDSPSARLRQLVRFLMVTKQRLSNGAVH